MTHDLFQLDPDPLGPYGKGAELGFTLEEWLAATGSGAYTVVGDQAQIDLSFEKLVPNGIYTLWCAAVSVPPAYKIVDKPCGAADGSENIFTASAEGKADIHLNVKTLPDSTAETIQVLAIAYHSDGKTYGPLPGDFGLNSHVQILFMIPAPEDAAWQIISGDSPLALSK